MAYQVQKNLQLLELGECSIEFFDKLKVKQSKIELVPLAAAVRYFVDCVTEKMLPCLHYLNEPLYRSLQEIAFDLLQIVHSRCGCEREDGGRRRVWPQFAADAAEYEAPV